VESKKRKYQRRRRPLPAGRVCGTIPGEGERGREGEGDLQEGRAHRPSRLLALHLHPRKKERKKKRRRKPLKGEEKKAAFLLFFPHPSSHVLLERERKKEEEDHPPKGSSAHRLHPQVRDLDVLSAKGERRKKRKEEERKEKTGPRKEGGKEERRHPLVGDPFLRYALWNICTSSIKRKGKKERKKSTTAEEQPSRHRCRRTFLVFVEGVLRSRHVKTKQEKRGKRGGEKGVSTNRGPRKHPLFPPATPLPNLSICATVPSPIKIISLGKRIEGGKTKKREKKKKRRGGVNSCDRGGGGEQSFSFFFFSFLLSPLSLFGWGGWRRERGGEGGGRKRGRGRPAKVRELGGGKFSSLPPPPQKEGRKRRFRERRTLDSFLFNFLMRAKRRWRRKKGKGRGKPYPGETTKRRPCLLSFSPLFF